MLKAIAKALAAGLKALWKAGVSVADDILALALSPVRAVFGGKGAAPAPCFTPDVDPTQLMSEIAEQPKRTQAARSLDRDALRSVLQFVKATPLQRATIDLSAVAPDVRATLLTMDEHELHALAAAGDRAIRRFADGKMHNVHGVPVIGPQPAPAARAMSTVEVMQERIRQRLGEQRSTPFPAKIV